MSELKPCPFCGGEARLSHAGAKHIIFCPNCVRLPADGGYINQEQAVAAWNNRADGWISIDDRLPENNTEVLISIDYGNGKQSVLMGYMRSQDVSWRGVVGQKLIGVTHWQPLPEPPKGDR